VKWSQVILFKWKHNQSAKQIVTTMETLILPAISLLIFTMVLKIKPHLRNS
jgi:hypothetical protein